MRSICFYCRSCAKNYDYAYFHKSPTSPAAKKKKKPFGYINMPLKLSDPVWISHFSTQKSQITHRERDGEGE